MLNYVMGHSDIAIVKWDVYTCMLIGLKHSLSEQRDILTKNNNTNTLTAKNPV